MSWKKKIEQAERELEKAEARQAKLPTDPSEFFKLLGREPYPHQLQLAELFEKSQFTAIRWCRQSGKSDTIARLLLKYACENPGSYIGVVAPSFRQSKLIIRKINSFTKKLPKGYCQKPQKTLTRLTNGSIIEAFPNNPETVRGPTLNVVYCDEMNFCADDEELYDAILFTLSATNGKFICSSTPWSTDSVFHKIFYHPDYKGEYAHSHITWRETLEPNGPLKKGILEKIQRQLQGDPWRWRREMEAEWGEDENVWLTQDLITRCIGTVKTLGYDLEYYNFEEHVRGEFYIGEDFGKHRDYSILAVVERKDDFLLLRYCHRFPLKTPYATVIGHTKVLCDRWTSVRAAYLDETGLGEYIVEDSKNAGVPNVEGINFTETQKEEMATILKQSMLDGKFWVPFDEALINELNVEKFELDKAGKIKLSHPEGSNDDRFWAVCLAVYASITGRQPINRPIAVGF